MPAPIPAPITIPEDAGFKDMVALKGKPDVGDQTNKNMIAPLIAASQLSDFPDFNDTKCDQTIEDLLLGAETALPIPTHLRIA